MALLAAPLAGAGVSDDAGSIPPNKLGPAFAAACTRLDVALLGFNRHALLAERYRRAVEQYLVSRQAFAEGAQERAALREARASAANHRIVVRAAVSQFVRLLRDGGAAPEVVLVAVKTRLTLSVTAATPGAPPSDASLLATDAALWTIKAYYDAA